jgi:hypothetical protein
MPSELDSESPYGTVSAWKSGGVRPGETAGDLHVEIGCGWHQDECGWCCGGDNGGRLWRQEAMWCGAVGVVSTVRRGSAI